MIADTKFDYVDKYGYLAYCHDLGYFMGFDPKQTSTIIQAQSCRESLGWLWRCDPGCGQPIFKSRIGLNTKKLDLAKMDEFLTQIEDILGLKERLILYPTAKENFVVIEIPAWWQANDTRFDFLTLFVRCAAIFYKGDFLQAMLDYSLTKAILPHIEFFLNGHTEPTYKSVKGEGYNGICSRIQGFNHETIKQALIAPKA